MSSHPSGTRMRWRAAADLGALVGDVRAGRRSGGPAKGEGADVGFDLVGGHVGDPDAGPFVGEAGGQPGRCGVEPGHRLVPHRAVQHGVARHAAGAGDRLGEDHRILVRVLVEVDVEPGQVAEQHGPETLPGDEVAGHRKRDPRAERAERDVGHEVHAEPFDERHPGVFDPAVVGAALPAFVGCQDDTTAADADGDALVDDDLGQPDPGHVAGGDQPGQQVQATVRSVPCRRVEHAFGFPRLSGVGRHDHADAGQPIRDVDVDGHASTLDAGADVAGGEVALEDDEQSDHRCRQHTRPGEDRSERVGRPGCEVGDVVGERRRPAAACRHPW